MKLNEIQTVENGIINIFQRNFENEYNIIFENQNANNLDLYILDFWGQRELKSTVSHETFERVLIAFISVNLQRWLDYIEFVNNTELNAVSNEIHTKKGTLATQRNEINTTAAKVFNDNDFVNDTQDNSNENKTDTYNLIEKIEKNENIVNNLNKILAFKQKNTIFGIIKEIIDYITLKIY